MGICQLTNPAKLFKYWNGKSREKMMRSASVAHSSNMKS